MSQRGNSLCHTIGVFKEYAWEAREWAREFQDLQENDKEIEEKLKRRFFASVIQILSSFELEEDPLRATIATVESDPIKIFLIPISIASVRPSYIATSSTKRGLLYCILQRSNCLYRRDNSLTKLIVPSFFIELKENLTHIHSRVQKATCQSLYRNHNRKII